MASVSLLPRSTRVRSARVVRTLGDSCRPIPVSSLFVCFFSFVLPSLAHGSSFFFFGRVRNEYSYIGEQPHRVLPGARADDHPVCHTREPGACIDPQSCPSWSERPRAYFAVGEIVGMTHIARDVLVFFVFVLFWSSGVFVLLWLRVSALCVCGWVVCVCSSIYIIYIYIFIICTRYNIYIIIYIYIYYNIYYICILVETLRTIGRRFGCNNNGTKVCHRTVGFKSYVQPQG